MTRGLDDVEELATLSDEALIGRIRSGAADGRNILFRRYHRKVARWCLRICGDRETAADLAQEVFLRVHQRLESFRMESRFSTWLYQVARNVSINRGIAARRRAALPLDHEDAPEPVDGSPGPDEELGKAEVLARFRRAMQQDLEPLEAKVLYLHHVDGVSLGGITEMLDLRNKSGAKAYVVSGTRKLRRQFGRWLTSPVGGATPGGTP